MNRWDLFKIKFNTDEIIKQFNEKHNIILCKTKEYSVTVKSVESKSSWIIMFNVEMQFIYVALYQSDIDNGNITIKLR
jgi:hypothetical protein